MARHIVVTFHRYLASLGQVAIDGNQRVQLTDVGRLGVGLMANLLVLCLQLLQRRIAGSLSVAGLLIVVGQLSPGIQFMTHHTQQVVTVHGAVFALDDKRIVRLSLGLRQQVRMCQSLRTIVVATRLPLFRQLVVAQIDLRQHCIVHSLQHRVALSLFLLLLQSGNGRRQRVRGHLSHQLGMQQR